MSYSPGFSGGGFNWGSNSMGGNPGWASAMGGMMGGGGGMGGLAGGAASGTPWGMIMKMIQMGAQSKLVENDLLNEDPDDPAGNVLLGAMGPSPSQNFTAIKENPVKGLASTFIPFSSPFLMSDKAKQTPPIWSTPFGFG